jgi:hypothetical protein
MKKPIKPFSNLLLFFCFAAPIYGVYITSTSFLKAR